MFDDIFIGAEVNKKRISSDAVIHPGCRIRGEKTSIGPGCEIGREAPATLENCRLGRNVKLKGGSFSDAVFLNGSNMGSGAHVRGGTILEEEAGGAHTVGLKQTILLPFVTLGSLINFCDILMAGGTSRKNHSEVGSSFIHFNFTPNQDKATASLVGDVPRGVLLKQNPIFLGGQGGIVGPARIAYGTVLAAGSICRHDVTQENRLIIQSPSKSGEIPFKTGMYGNVKQIFRNCLLYIGNIKALRAWYEIIRIRFIVDDFDRWIHEGALENLDLILNERIRRLEPLAIRFPGLLQASAEPSKNPETFHRILDAPAGTKPPPALTAAVEKADKSYIAAVQKFDEETRRETTDWLQSIVNETVNLLN